MRTDWVRELRHALRNLRRTPGFTALAVGTLGLAIGANAGIFSVVDTVLLDPLPYAAPDRLVAIAASAPGSDMPEEFGVSAEFFLQYEEQSELLQDLALYDGFTATLRADDRVERVRMAAGTPAILETLGVGPILGRMPKAEEETGVMLISHDLWMTWFGGDPGILGRTYHAAGEERTIIGVMGPEFWFPQDGTLLWIPQALRAEDIEPGNFGAALVGRLAPGADVEALESELATLAQRLPERFGGSAGYARIIAQHRPVVRSLESELLGDVAKPLWILLGAMALVLVIACANVANLFMVRAERRLPDLAVRRALGAGRGRLIVAQLAEATIVAGLAALLALALAWAAVPLLVRAAPAEIPRLADVAIRPTTLLFTGAVAALAALLCGLFPAIRFSAPKLSQLRDRGRGSTRRRAWGRNVVVAAQTALALTLLIGSALLMRSLDRLRGVDPGYDTRDVFTFQIAPEGPHLEDAASYARFHTEFMARVAALPGVESVGVVENVPLDEGLSAGRVRTDATAGQENDGALVSLTWTAGDYFRTMGIEVLRGRVLTPDDHVSQLGNVLVSRSAAELLWPGENPLGKRLQIEEQETWETVVGVVDDVRQYGFREPAEPMLYLPLVGQTPETSRTVSSPGYVVKTTRAEDIAPDIRALVRELAPDAPMYRTYTLAFLEERSMVQLSFTALTLGIAAVLALILGVVGLYGVLSYAVAERTREIGLRMALGAPARRVRLMIVGQGTRVVVAGIVVGALTALVGTRALGSLLFETAPFELTTYVGVSAAMVVVGLLATYLPARRASRVDPMVSLRAD